MLMTVVCISFLLAIVGSYLLGNLNGAVIASRLHHDDVRSHGSGNAGLTNFIRNYGVKSAFLVILVDAGKAVLACLISGWLFYPMGRQLEGMALGGFFVMLGHCFPALLGFRGGKGILSGLFVALVIDWRIGVIILVVFLLGYLLSGYVSLGSVLASVTFGIGFVVFHSREPFVMWFGIAMAALCVYMHRGNIRRLVKGQEPKTNLLKKGGRK
ncbi:MAG: glycerol-3-phosphate acyltransferase [Eubacteriales bacterium]|nr:glycerol-3-phosphate acyltransferase [Eubacteriales bacterium]